MGLFSSAPKKTAPSSGSSHIQSSDNHHDHGHNREASNDSSFGDSRVKNLSPYELRKQVRGDLHDKLGRNKGEEVFNILTAHLDKDRMFEAKGVSGREIDSTLKMLRENHQDNLHDSEIGHVEDVLRKHFND